MIEWIQHLGEMRFFPWSPFSWLILGPLYLGGAAVIAFVCWLLAKTWKPAWLPAIPLLLVLAVAPLWEELGIAYNFGKLCKKDAGIFVYKTVEVEGFYDDTGGTMGLVRDGGYQWAEGPRRDGKGAYRLSKGDANLARQAMRQFEAENPGAKATDRSTLRVYVHPDVEVLVFPAKNESWRMQILEQPTARYHYRWPSMSEAVSHKIVKGERVVLDDQTGEVLGRHLNYARKAPWFFVHLDRPNMGCMEVKEDARQRGNVFGPNMVLRPTR